MHPATTLFKEQNYKIMNVHTEIHIICNESNVSNVYYWLGCIHTFVCNIYQIASVILHCSNYRDIYSPYNNTNNNY